MPQTTELVVVCRLPLAVRPLDGEPEQATLAQFAHAAVQVLQGELTADERRRVEPRSEEDALVLQELHRVEAKVDLLLDLFAQWHQREQGLPPPVDCRWSAVDLQWEAEHLPSGFTALGNFGVPSAPLLPTPAVAQLYPGPRSLRPLELPGQLSASASARGWHCRLVYGELGEGFADLLGRYLFRLHRREVAEIRGASRR